MMLHNIRDFAMQSVTKAVNGCCLQRFVVSEPVYCVTADSVSINKHIGADLFLFQIFPKRFISYHLPAPIKSLSLA